MRGGSSGSFFREERDCRFCPKRGVDKYILSKVGGLSLNDCGTDSEDSVRSPWTTIVKFLRVVHRNHEALQPQSRWCLSCGSGGFRQGSY